MKKNKMICIDEGLAEKLNKEDNASKLINDLLNKHYFVNPYLKLTPEQLKEVEELAKLEAEIKRRVREVELKYGLN